METEIPTPKTIEELCRAIESIFEPMGESKRAYDMVGDQRVAVHTYVAGMNTENRHSFDNLDLYFPDPAGAIAETWARMKRMRYDACYGLNKEELEDGDPFRFLPARVIWRMRPELITHSTGICTVRFRAAFI